MRQVFAPFVSALGAALLLAHSASAQCKVGEIALPGVGEADAFGSSAALSGDLLVVGARLDDEAGTDAGALYVFERIGGAWQQTGKITVPGSTYLGVDVAVDDGRILAGATSGADLVQQADAAYVLERIGGVWTVVAELTPPDPVPQDSFGYAVSLAGDVAVVGRPWQGFPGPGQAYVYESIGGVWVETAVVDGGFLTGSAVATDGERVLVASFPGVLVLERSGGTWTAVDSLVPESIPLSSFFHKDVAISGDLAFVPSEQNDIVASLHVFERGPSGWDETAVLFSDPLFESTYFGNTISYSPEAGVLLVGSPLYENAVHGYLRQGSSWSELFELYGEGSGFGYGASIDGHRVGVTQPGNDFVEVVSTAFVYELGVGLALFGCPQAVSLETGGKQRFTLDSGAGLAGELYLLLGSASGTSPGLASGAFVLPLNLDNYLLWTLLHPSTPPLVGTLGFLDPAGKAQAEWSLPPGVDPGLAGVLLHHAYMVLEMPELHLIAVSPATPLKLVP